MRRPSMWTAFAALAAFGPACGPQAGEDYLGEPLLQMRGHVTTSGLTTEQPIVPALCFVKTARGGVLDMSTLPAAVQPTFVGVMTGRSDDLAYIVDVEVQGSFPAEFNVNVYEPPPAAAIAPLFAGEPPSAWGSVCAVQADHGPVSEQVTGLGGKQCGPGGTPCHFSNIVMTSSASRYYFEHADCPSDEPSAEECVISRGGDITLMAETGGYENTVGLVLDPEVVYLAAPAPPGSYTAYKLGAAEGLPAGYHLRTQYLGPLDEAEQEAYQETLRSVEERARVETNALHGTKHPQIPQYLDETGFVFVPPDVAATYDRIRARIEMETIPLPARSAVSPDGPGLTLDLQEGSNWAERLPPLLSRPLLPLPLPEP